MLVLVDFRKGRKVELPWHGHVSSGTEVVNFIFHVLAEFEVLDFRVSSKPHSDGVRGFDSRRGL